MQTKKLINQILTKQINPTQIYKGSVSNLLTIEVVTINPIEYISLIYKSEELRDKAFRLLDDKAFWVLSFNPIPGPPYVAPPPLPPLYTPPYGCYIGAMMIHAKIFPEFF